MTNVLPPSCFRTARRLALAALLAATAAIPALPRPAGAVTRPARDDNGVPRDARAAPATGPGADDGGPAADEWTRAEKFIAEKSPNKWTMYENLPDRGNLKRQLRQQLVKRYQALQRMKDNDPERHELEERAIEIEDEIYGVLRDLDVAMKEGRDPGPDETRLRDKVGDLVENRDRWKVKRLERVARELRSMNGGGHLTAAVNTVDGEAKRLRSLGHEDRGQRIENRVKEFKQMMTGTKARPSLGRPLPGPQSQPVDAPVPAAEPAAAPSTP